MITKQNISPLFMTLYRILYFGTLQPHLEVCQKNSAKKFEICWSSNWGKNSSKPLTCLLQRSRIGVQETTWLYQTILAKEIHGFQLHDEKDETTTASADFQIFVVVREDPMEVK